MAFTIKDLEVLSGVKAHTIRIWEQRYQFLKPSRTPTNIRMYNNEELKVLLTVSLLNRYGYKISRIDEMQQEERNRALLNLSPGSARLEHSVNQLIGCMIDLKASEFEGILEEYIRTFGVDAAMTSLIFHFLEKVGVLWQTSRINPAHEHIATNIIRQKLISSIETLPVPAPSGPLCLLFLPEGQHHEMGLLFVHFLLKRRGVPVLYLGANVPLTDALYITRVKTPAYIYIHLTTLLNTFQFPKYINALSNGAPETKVLLSGSVLQGYKKNLPQNVHLLQSLTEVTAYIEGIG